MKPARLRTSPLLVFTLALWCGGPTSASAQTSTQRTGDIGPASIPPTLTSSQDCTSGPGTTTFALRERTSEEVANGGPLRCDFTLTVPRRTGGRWVLTVRTASSTALLGVDVSGRSPAWLRGRTGVDLASDYSAADIELLLPDEFAGKIAVNRVDIGLEAITFDAVAHWVRQGGGLDGVDQFAGRGHSLRVSLDGGDYRTLVALARGLTTRAPVDASVKRAAHEILDVLTGRDGDQWTESATRSEPMVVFVGLSGINKVVLSDQIAWPMQAEEGEGRRYAEPWQTTFERGSSFWAVYLEEENTPFFTSVDAQFGPRSQATDHDEFDPQGMARFDLNSAGELRVRRVRVGYKRFRMPDNFNQVLVTFSRQSSSYGLRQWGRTFTQYGRFPFRVAAGVFSPAPTISRRDYVLTPVFVDAALAPDALAIDDHRTRQPIFATVSVRLPQLRDSAEQSRVGFGRLARALTPEPIVGIGIPTIQHAGFLGQSLLAGLSWPIVGERVSVVVGGVKIKQPYANGSFKLSERLPAEISIDELRTLRSSWKVIVGINLDLIHTW